MRFTAVRVAIAIAIVGVLLVSGIELARGDSPIPPAAPSPGTSTDQTGTHSIWNVVVIYLENFDIQDVNGQPNPSYFKYLDTAYVNATAFYSVCHPSAPNYIALLDGDPHQCNSETTNRGLYHNTTLPDLMDAKGLTWGGYFESMSKPCQGISSGQAKPLYLANFNPFLYFSDIYGNTARCDAHVVNSSVFNSTIASTHNFPANFSFYLPNSDDSCHYTKLPVCQVWLKNFLNQFINATGPLATAVKHTVFFILPDESDDVHLTGPGGRGDGAPSNQTSWDGAGYSGLYGGNIWLGVINTGGYVVHGHYRQQASIYNLLTTIEWLFGLGNTGGVDKGSAFPAMTGLFTFSSNHY